MHGVRELGCASLLLSPTFLEVSKIKRGGQMKKIGVFLLLASFFAVSSILSQPANAQTVTTGTVIGTVTDPSSAAGVDAAVVMRNKGTNGQVTQRTNSAGQYTFVNVTPGEYEITVKKDGFRTSDVASLIVE